MTRAFAHGPEASAIAPTTRGTWRHWVCGRERKATVAICCPGCGGALALPRHTVAPDGAVAPSVVCTHAGCGFHEFIRLEGWS